MDLPFSPTFFKKLDIYQRLLIFENQGKPIWYAEKLLLEWAASQHHQHLGAYISEGTAKRAFDKPLAEGRFNNHKKEAAYVADAQHVLDALVVRGFADERPNLPKEVRINKDGLMAGTVLNETNLLNNKWSYQIWILIWWIILTLALIILVGQATSAISMINNFLIVPIIKIIN